MTRCLHSIRTALAGNTRADLESEIIVADNNSTDSTAELARNEGAAVVFEPINQISRARNAGAGVANGDWFLFVDADCELSADSLRDLLAQIARGDCAGGGSIITLDEAPRAARLLITCWNRIALVFTVIAGCFIFCKAEAFREIGGFSLELFSCEEVKFAVDLKRWARARRLRVVILRETPHVTSGRKFSLYSKREWAALCWRFITSPAKSARQRLNLHYDGRR